MAGASLAVSVERLAIAGEQAGFTVEQMIELLNAGLTVSTLLDLIEWRLQRCQPRVYHSSSNWMM